MRTYVLKPTAPGKYPGIVFYSEIFQARARLSPALRSALLAPRVGYALAPCAPGAAGACVRRQRAPGVQDAAALASGARMRQRATHGWSARHALTRTDSR